MRILYIGSLNKTSNSFRRFKTLADIGHDTTGIDIDPYIYKGSFTRLHHHLNVGPGITALNKKIQEEASRMKPAIVWVDNKPFLTAATLQKIKATQPFARIVNMITDDATGRLKYAWSLCLRTARYYDCHFVQRMVNVQELTNYGAKRVALCYRSFDPDFHRPLVLTGEDIRKYTTPVGFVGTYEAQREAYIASLIENDIPVAVTGNDWQKGKRWNTIQPFYKGPSVYGEPYVKTINGMDIALHFLRHGNRDEQDSRTFEIPACKVFMMAQRSDLHAKLFKEDEEAVFFTSQAELLQKVRFYLSHEKERSNIAANGYKKSFDGGYDHAARLQTAINSLFEQGKMVNQNRAI